ncbi:MAG TPA: DMT family transporter [Thermoanaerobaculia bacterium]|nr:DMT family transporter [Thermoanaerobaculia bacterium]
MKPTRLLTAAALATLILIWGTTWAAIRISLQGIPPITGVALRFAIAAVVLLALVPVFGIKLGRSRIERRLWLANGMLTFAIPYGVLYWAEQWVPSGLASVLFATYPLMVAVVAHFLLAGEPLSLPKIAGVLIGFAGLAVIFSEDLRALGGPRVATAAAILLISPLCASFGSVIVKRWGEGVHPLSISAMPMAITAVVMGPVAWLAESGREVTFSLGPVLALLYLALLGSALPFTLFFWLLKHQTATGMSLINYAIPVIAVAVGTVFFDEPFTLRIVVGTALVLVGVAVAMRKKQKGA